MMWQAADCKVSYTHGGHFDFVLASFFLAFMMVAVVDNSLSPGSL